MKVKTSVSLSEDVLAEIDREAPQSRSEYIERVLKRHFRVQRREERGRHDRELLQDFLESPDFESDVLDYTIDPLGLGDEVEVLRDDEPVRRAG